MEKPLNDESAENSTNTKKPTICAQEILNDISLNTSRKLPHIKLKIGGKKCTHTEVLATFDNCNTDGIISLGLLQELQKKSNIVCKPTEPGVNIGAAFQGASTIPIGTAEIYLQFADEDDSFIIPYTVFVCEDLLYPFFLGNDIIYSEQLRHSEGKSSVTFQHPSRASTVTLPFIF